MTFNFTFLPGTSAQAQQAFIDAGARWSALYSDNITLDMTVGTAALAAGIPTSSESRRASFTYLNFKSALTGDITSANAIATNVCPRPQRAIFVEYTAWAGSRRPFTHSP